VKVRLLACLLVGSVVASLSAQTCSNTSTNNRLICSVPQLFGPGGLTLPNNAHEAHFASSSLNTFRPLNTAIGEELSSLLLGSSGSGVSFTYDAKLQTSVSTEESFGPILTDRPETLGPKKIAVGVAYQYFGFGEIDGLHLDRLPAVLKHEVPPGSTPQKYQNDYHDTSNKVSLNLHQVTVYGDYGVTRNLDVSIAVPIERVHLGVTSNAFIVRTQPCELNHSCTDTGVGSDPSGTLCGEFHYFDASSCTAQFTSVSKTFQNGGESSGVGDLILRAKYALKGEKYAVAGGVDVRVPTGDAKNFLGAGAPGVTPYVTAAYKARFSPHIRFGYEWNGDSVLAGNPTDATATSANLPHEFLYSGGVDVWATRRITIAADLLGQRVFDASRLKLGSYPDFFGNSVPDIQSYTGSYNSDSVALGAKARLIGRLILTFNITKRADSGGLHANVVPLVGLSYSLR